MSFPRTHWNVGVNFEGILGSSKHADVDVGRVFEAIIETVNEDFIPPKFIQGKMTDGVLMDADESELAGNALLEYHTQPNEDFTPQKAYDVIISHRRLQINSIQIIMNNEMIAKKSMMEIPLCRMVNLQVVQLAL